MLFKMGVNSNMDRVKLFVGCCSNGEDAESMAVLEYSVKKNSSLPVDITWMMQTHDETSPYYGWATETWATPFLVFVGPFQKFVISKVEQSTVTVISFG